jgi:predicted metal-dependent HD superfamily phosphohydrolase
MALKEIYALDDLTGYEYHLLYCQDFYSPYRSGLELRDALQRDFVMNLGRFFKRVMKIDGETSFSIAHSLYAYMMNNVRHFHTPYWTMWKFHFAAMNKIKLSPEEQLAIWFRHAIHLPWAAMGLNEQQSVSLMRAMVPYGYKMNDNGVLNAADRAIVAHSDHRKEVDAGFQLLLDLDLSILASHEDIFAQAMLCWSTEYGEIGRRFKASMRKFFMEILGRPSIYRTDIFKQKFEEQARAVLARWVEGPG